MIWWQKLVAFFSAFCLILGFLFFAGSAFGESELGVQRLGPGLRLFVAFIFITAGFAGGGYILGRLLFG